MIAARVHAVRPARNWCAVALSTATSPQEDSRPHVAILGTGWGGYHLAKTIDKEKFAVTVISPANYFLITPMLPGAAVGGIEFRAIQEPIRSVKGLDHYHQAKARSVNFDERTIMCQDVFKGQTFNVPYDYLVISTGMKTNTFGTPGIMEREGKDVFFLKHLWHARGIRSRLIECFERAALPSTSEAEKKRLLSFVVVGGGATGCEFVGELYDFVHDDVSYWYGNEHLKEHISIHLVEGGPSLLGPFDQQLVSRLMSNFKSKKIDVKLQKSVQSIEDFGFDSDGAHKQVVELSDGEQIPFGCLVWCGGNAPVKFTERLKLDKGPGGRILVNETLQVPDKDGRVFAFGDAAVIEEMPLPTIAMAAYQQGCYLGKCFNDHYADLPAGSQAPQTASPTGALAKFDMGKHGGLGRLFSGAAMVSIGTTSGFGLVDMTHIKPWNDEWAKSQGIGKEGVKVGKFAGFLAWVIWKGSYFTLYSSWKNRMLIPMYWFKTFVFGRDVSRF